MTPDSDSSFEAMLREAAELRAPGMADARLPQRGELLQEKYRIEERLGVGGMGAVFRATNVENGKQVAIKWLLSRSAKACARFEREARTGAQIDHPNVVNVFDLGVHRGGTFLVMELLRGSSLRRRLSAGALSPAELVGVMLPVLRGVRAAHAAGVIHRDLKPDNVFLCVASDGTAWEPKVLDFGISKLRREPAQAERLTGEGSGLGTLEYMSPEQLADAASVDERTDIYAAGVMMYEGLAGSLPFHAENTAALVLAITASKAPTLRALVPGLDRALEGIVMRAMAKEPRDRYPDVQSLIDDLASWSRRARESTGAEPETRPEPLQSSAHSVRRSRRWPGAVLLAASLGLSLWMAARASSPARQLAQARPTPVRAVSADPAHAPSSLSPSREQSAAPRPEPLVAPTAPVSGAAASSGALPSSKRPAAQAVRAPSRAGALRRSEL